MCVSAPLRSQDSRIDLPVRVDVDAPASSASTVYDLISNVVHESTAGTTRDKANTIWKVQLKAGKVSGTADAASGPTEDSSVDDDEKWFQLQDLVVEEVQKEMIFLGETVLQVRPRPLLCASTCLTVRS